ncbi:MAG: hypothetical protein K2K79_05985 [Paramuribaculum sp.]|nr:hypothetical protein [Paramuribaculum sp.]
MGAMVRYKQLTRHEVTEIGNNISDVCSYLYCSVAAACSREKIEFGMELLEFADAIDVEDLNAWSARPHRRSSSPSPGIKQSIGKRPMLRKYLRRKPAHALRLASESDQQLPPHGVSEPPSALSIAIAANIRTAAMKRINTHVSTVAMGLYS